MMCISKNEKDNIDNTKIIQIQRDDSNENKMSLCKPWRIVWNAVSTFVEWSADVSIKEREERIAKFLASSVGTLRKWRRSDLLPTSIMTILGSAWSRSSFSQRSTFSKVACFDIS